MICSILKQLGLLFVTAITAIILKQVVCYLKMNKYRTQGIKCFFFPLFGIRKSLPRGANFKRIRDVCDEKAKGAQIVAGNSLARLEPHLFITGPGLVKEFLLLDNDYFKKTGFSEKVYPNKSFVYENGAAAMKYRGIYTGFFQAENIKKIIPRIEAVFEESFKNLAVKLFEDKVELGPEGHLKLKQ